MEDKLIIGYVKAEKEDHIQLIVARKKKDGTIDIINDFLDKEAEKIYNILTNKEE